jgi:hypothetical protein
MPSLEIICIGQSEPLDFSDLPFVVKAERELKSHRLPSPLFQPDFDKLTSCIYHVLDNCQPECNTCFELLIRDWHDEAGNSNGRDENVEFRNEYANGMKRMIERLLEDSPVGQILFTTDYQFGPPEAQRFGPMTFTAFKDLYNAGHVRMNTAYLVTSG